MNNVNVSRSRIIGVMRVLVMLVGLLWFGAIIVRAADRYVAQGGQTPAPDYESWATAASNIQDAITVASGGETVWVSNGVYETGGVTNWPSGSLLTNRVAITNAITVRSANNDPTNTIIKGAGTNCNAAVRCVYMTNGSSLIGFMLTNGATRSEGAGGDRYGGGVYCEGNAIISNCVIVSNLAYSGAAGVRGGTLYNCIITNNLAYPNGVASAVTGGGARNSTLYDCTIAKNRILSSVQSYGAGVRDCVLSNCTISCNTMGNGRGGGASASTLYNCTVTGNYTFNGGGASGGTLYNCTIEDNDSQVGSGGGTTDGSILYNCILRRNTAWAGAGTADGGGAHNSTLYNCLIVSNRATRNGGGANLCTLYNCTIISNTPATAGSGAGGGAYTSTLYNCISWGNQQVDSNITAYYSCGVDYSGNSNITNNPLFVNSPGGNYRLVASSPAVNTGFNEAWMTNAADLDGNRRIDRFSGCVDMGAYEFAPQGSMFRMY